MPLRKARAEIPKYPKQLGDLKGKQGVRVSYGFFYSPGLPYWTRGRNVSPTLLMKELRFVF
jgi:ABC-type Fe3+-hydroxamate transport system substrate-binding protein